MSCKGKLSTGMLNICFSYWDISILTRMNVRILPWTFCYRKGITWCRVKVYNHFYFSGKE